jgi:hypothetical protein
MHPQTKPCERREHLVKLARIGCRVAWAWDDLNAFSFTPEEVEFLAELEHDRWSETLVAQGWQAGTLRDEIARVHPDLIPWDDLPEERRGIDRDHGTPLEDLHLELAQPFRTTFSRRALSVDGEPLFPAWP